MAPDDAEITSAFANLYGKIPGGGGEPINAGNGSSIEGGFGDSNPWDGKPCPPGFLCEGWAQLSCEDLRQAAIDKGFGDIHAGAYCPGNKTNRAHVIYENCEIGYYCPNTTTKLLCPKGYYCPWKTAFPYIECKGCRAGATILARNALGYYVLGFFMLCAFIAFGMIYIRRRKRLQKDVLNELQRLLADSDSKMKERKEREEKLQRLRPKLEKIQMRVLELIAAKERRETIEMERGRRQNPKQRRQRQQQLQQPKHRRRHSFQDDSAHFDIESGVASSSLPSPQGVGPDKMFDVLDENGSGVLQYSQLNSILDLTVLQLREFIRRMNLLAGLSSEAKSCTRSVFLRYFLPVLEVSSNFAPTSDEVAALFDRIADKQGHNRDGEIYYKSFYLSELTEFLNDSQINDMIKRLQRMKIALIEMELSASVASNTSKRSFRYRGTNRENVGGKARGKQGSGRRLQRRGSELSLNSLGSAQNGVLSYQNGKQKTIGRDHFIEFYPIVLLDVLGSPVVESSTLRFHMGDDDDQNISSPNLLSSIDIAFEDLSLAVKVGQHSVNVVDNVTGRLVSGTMTALMGGSGAGKTSLLNALCGRAYYGEVTGNIKVNGHSTSIEKHMSAIGFVPQDDIVYAELTVRENFRFSGKFSLPKGTSNEEIEDLADAVMAGLGLARVADTVVGDVTRRGVSGGERKRVNIGLELMSLPSILVLDEPTSGLDSSSAYLVMQSLRNLVDKQKVTVCSVIHQPRKVIYELFDNIILLGEGGKMIYYGEVSEAEEYFKDMNYDLPQGESVPDWLIDISSGRLVPKSKLEKIRRAAPRRRTMSDDGGEWDMPSGRGGGGLEAMARALASNGTGGAGTTNSRAAPARRRTKRNNSDGGSTCDLRRVMMTRSDSCSGTSSNRSLFNSDTEEVHSVHSFASDHFDEVGVDGPSGQQFVRAKDAAKARREKLCRRWNKYCKQRSKHKSKMIDAPQPYPLPSSKRKPSFLDQLVLHLRRHWIVYKRNWVTKLIDTSIIVVAVSVISALDGVVEITVERPVDVSLAGMLSETDPPVDELFGFAVRAQKDLIEYGLKVGVVVAVLVGLSATKILTEKRENFFREASNGYSVNAYFLAINIIATIEHSIQVLVAAVFALWLRSTVTYHGTSYIVNFLMLSWLCVSWAMLFPIIVPVKNVVLVTGFFMSFMSLLFSGAISPVTYRDIYETRLLAVFCGFFSPTRYFVESLAISESRCLPSQSGFTDLGPNTPEEAYSISQAGVALNDITAVTQRSCNGWYWGVIPAFLVGFTVRIIAMGALHVYGRGKQAKKPFFRQIRFKLQTNSVKLPMLAIAYEMLVVVLIFFSCLFIVREK